MDGHPYWNLNLGWAIPMAGAALLVLGGFSWLLTRRKGRRTRWLAWGLLLPVLLAVNPCSGWIVWEPINKHLLTGMKAEAERVGLEGKTFPEIEALFGDPSFVWGPDDDEVVTWNYLRPPFYLFGSKFQVHFKRGVVSGWEAYDD